MPKLRIKRFYYRNGHLQAEVREVGGEFHGFNRTWHHNDQLAEELHYRHGLLHGLSRQWDEKGRLLGSFTLNHGTGTQRYWHQNGKLRLEINSLNGKFHGRMRLWLRDGTLVQETYYINNVDVRVNGLLEGLPQQILAGFRVGDVLEDGEHNVVADQTFSRAEKTEIAHDDLAFVRGEFVGFPQFDVALHGNFGRHPMVRAAVEIMFPGPFVFERHKLVHIHGTAIQQPFVRRIDAFG
jgi:hypothetical protein